MKISHLPVRLAAGAFFLNSGISKLGMGEEQAAGLRQMGAAGLPLLDKLDDKTFAKALPAGEIALGAALLLPFVPSWLAGLGLTAFGSGLVNMYLHTPGMTQEDGIRPTQEGIGLAKDVAFAGIGATLVLDSIFSRRRVVKKVRADKIKVKKAHREH
ncbi:hypothetical protein GA0111570_10941 [Raineyella antarctica]|uniref:DoxX protein n=1 Tax=Raineyella antarctica TaxID=1577474 RepID=A0A1G6HEC8_9ACTN|nr:hypothetical protein [Raineyella antarctica]SDB92581.1 hypothetical protein GA0111570_10941 [Raineyella antarctica]